MQKSGDLLTLYAKEFSAECLKLVTGLTNMSADEMDRVSQGMIDGCSNYTGDINIEKYCNNCTESIDAHINEIVRTKNRDSDFSMISTMLEGNLSADQISANIKLAISGGQNEPRDAIAGCIWAALNFGLKENLLQKNNWNQLFNEYCRWMSPIGMSPRDRQHVCGCPASSSDQSLLVSIEFLRVFLSLKPSIVVAGDRAGSSNPHPRLWPATFF